MNCTHPNQKLYSYALGRRTTELCDDCYRSLVDGTGMYLRPIERRAPDRPFRAPWRDRLPGRDESGRVA